MGRYRIRVHPGIDPEYILTDWDHLVQYMRDFDDHSMFPLKVILEIGSGLGEFLIEYAKIKSSQTCSQYLYIGLDGQQKRVLKASEKLWRQKINHVRFAYHWVGLDFLSQWPPVPCAEIHIHHPDPWPKKKQQHRRIVRPDMLPIYHSLLTEKGFLWLSTDHLSYAMDMKSLLSQSELFDLQGNDFLFRPEIDAYDLPLTKFEEKLAAKGFPSYFLLAQKI